MKQAFFVRSSRWFSPGRVAAAALLLAWGGACASPTLAAEATGEKQLQNIPSSAVTDADVIAFIDAQIRQGWKDAELTPSMKAPDNEWCRRAYLDVIGRLPTVDELERFLKEPGGSKKAKLMDRLLDSEEYQEAYAKNWATIWSNLLVGRPPQRNANREMTNREGMSNYLRRSFLTNKPYDKMAFELVSATGSTKPGDTNFNGATNFLVGKLMENGTEATSKTARVFMGMQVQCTQCHNHPFNDSKQDQFWSMNAFFRQTKATSTRVGRDIDSTLLQNENFAGEGSTPSEAEIYFELRNGTMQVAYPAFVDGTKINPSGYVTEVDRRAELGKLIAKSEYLGKSIVNRMWSQFLGYGFTKPVDDMGPHNPPSHPELVDRLGKEFAAHGHDLKRLIRWITLSEAYSLSSKGTPRNRKDNPSLGEKPKFSHFYLRQMQAEQLYESLLKTTMADKTKSEEERARDRSMWLTQFTVTFGNDEGEEATTFNGTIPQALMLMNGDMIKSATSIEPGNFLSWVATNMKGSDAVNFLFLAALSRKPTSAEVGNLGASLRVAEPLAAYQDIWWALLNSNEFIFNH
jgi:hypothetical protein